jgi:hypothetical protein
VAERARQALPQPALEVVHHREEQRGEERRRNPDHGTEPDESQINAAVDGGLGHAGVRRQRA